jgi:type I restriction enzyme S subunit
MNRISCKLSELVEVKNGSTPSTTRSDFYDGNIVWITPKDLSINKSKFIYSSERKITKAGFDSCSTSLLPIGSVLLSSRAPIGLLAICAVETCTNQGFKNLVLKKDKLHNEYLYYWLKTKVKYIDSLGTGTTFKEVSKGVIENLSIEIPKDIKDQQKIASVLSALDSKIELNNRINAELEAMAKTLYDYWFVQFDFPDENGKPYKTSGGMMVWNEELKREIPEGWEVKKVKDFAQTGSGGTPLKSKLEYFENGNIPWINSGEVNASFIVKAEKFITEKGLNNSSAKLFKKGTLLMAMYGATAGQVSLMDLEACTNQAICGINPNDEKLTIYLKFGLEDLYTYLISLSSGSARDNLSQDKIKDLQFLIPSKELIELFDNQASKMMKKILSNLKENQKLIELRDWLLPMLMNGQVKVSEL